MRPDAMCCAAAARACATAAAERSMAESSFWSLSDQNLD